MNQDIFTFTIVLAAVAYALWSIYRAVRPRRASACGGCAGCGPAKELQGCQTPKTYTNDTGKRLSQL